MVDIFIIAVIIGLMVLAIRHHLKVSKASGCGCGCSGCKQSCNASQKNNK